MTDILRTALNNGMLSTSDTHERLAHFRAHVVRQRLQGLIDDVAYDKWIIEITQREALLQASHD